MTGQVSALHATPGCDITVQDESTKMHCLGRCDDGSDGSFVSPHVAKKAVLERIGRLHMIDPVTV